jgi:type VII secretion protein EccE
VTDRHELATASLLHRLLPLHRLLVVQASVLAGVIAAPGFGLIRGYGAAAGLLASALLVAPVRGGTPAGWLRLRMSWWYHRRRRPALAEPFDDEQPDGSPIGFVWDGATLTSLIRIEASRAALTVMEPARVVSAPTISLELLANCLQQYDIELSSIDVLCHGSRFGAANPAAAVYPTVVGPLPAVADRAVWVAVRFDPVASPEAVGRRGGGMDGIRRAGTTATRRIADRLHQAGLRTEIMTAAGIRAATRHLAHGVDLATVDEHWTHCRTKNVVQKSYSVGSEIEQLWTLPVDGTTVGVSLRSGARAGLLQLRGLVRLDDRLLHNETPRAWRSLGGRQYSALLHTLPGAAPAEGPPAWVHGPIDGPLGDLGIPVAGCGQLIGADEFGRAVAVPVFGRHVRRVEICGPLDLAQQMVLRAVALGARVRVHTDRPAPWAELAHRIGDLLILAGDEARATAEPTLEVFDGVAEQSTGATTMVVSTAQTMPSAAADVTLQLVDPAENQVRVNAGGASAVVTMVTTEAEMRFLDTFSVDPFDVLAEAAS